MRQVAPLLMLITVRHRYSPPSPLVRGTKDSDSLRINKQYVASCVDNWSYVQSETLSVRCIIPFVDVSSVYFLIKFPRVRATYTINYVHRISTPTKKYIHTVSYYSDQQ